MTLPPGDDPHVEQSPLDFIGEVHTEDSRTGDAPLESDVSALLEESSLESPSPEPLDTEEPALFANLFQPVVRPPVRIPHLGHVALFAVYFLFGIVAAGGYLGIFAYFHFFKVSSIQGAVNDVHGALGSEVILYAVMFAAAYFTLPLVWHKSFFAGVQWNGAAALRLRKRLFGAGFVCFLLAILNMIFIPGPANAPIEKVFKQPGAAWLLFFFGITVAPFFEELVFRGFLLPALCTAYDWLAEMLFHVPRRPLAPDGGPQWSISAMAIASIVTSAPFALMHAEQTGNSVDAVLLLACVSLVLCAIRLLTRSLASSVLVHAFYNFLLFSMMLLGTEGFQHLDKI
jgi:membrane protease YdiL (CAAX protease family)